MAAGRIGWPLLGSDVSLTVTANRVTGTLGSQRYPYISWTAALNPESGVYTHTDPTLFPARVVSGYEGNGAAITNEVAAYDVTDEATTGIFAASGSIIKAYQSGVAGQMFRLDIKKKQPFVTGRSYAMGRGHGAPTSTAYAVWTRQVSNYASYSGPHTDAWTHDFIRSSFTAAGQLEGPEYMFYDFRPERSPDAVKVLMSGRYGQQAYVDTITKSITLTGAVGDEKRGFFASITKSSAVNLRTITLNGTAPTEIYETVVSGNCKGYIAFWAYDLLDFTGNATLQAVMTGGPDQPWAMLWMEATNCAASGHTMLSAIRTVPRIGQVSVDSITYYEFKFTLPSSPEGDVIMSDMIVTSTQTADQPIAGKNMLAPRAGDSSWVTNPLSATDAFIDPMGAIGTSPELYGFARFGNSTANAIGWVLVPKRWENPFVVVPVSTSEKIKHPISEVAAATPATGRLAGELAFNLADKKMWVYDSAGNPVEIV